MQNLAYTALLLGVLITVHELGHFLVAKALGVKVLRFSIGFGPALLRFTRGETEYRIALLPLGGYVKMAGDLPHEELPPEEAKRGFLAQPPWKRALIVAAGPVFNLVFPVLVYFFVFFGDRQVASTRVMSVEPGLPAASAGIRPGDRITRVDGQAVETFPELLDALQPTYGKQVTLTYVRDGREQTTTLVPAKHEESNALESVTRGLIGIALSPRPPTLGVAQGSAADVAGLRTFDRVVSINGKPIGDEMSLVDALAGLSGPLEVEVLRPEPLELPGAPAVAPRLVKVTVPRQEGDGFAALGAEKADLYVATVVPGSEAAKAGLKAGDRLAAVDGAPLPGHEVFRQYLKRQGIKPFELTWRSGAQERSARVAQAQVDTKDELGAKAQRLDLGLRMWSHGLEEDLERETVTQRLGVRAALVESLRIVPDVIAKTVLVVGRLFTGAIPFDNVGGPILLYDLAARSAEQGLDAFLNLIAVISINLGVMNLLPIPILDGFHLLSAVWEGIRRRPIPVRAREIANYIGLAVLLVLMFFVFKNDLTR